MPRRQHGGCFSADENIIRRLRLEKGLTQEALAAKAGLSIGVIKKAEASKRLSIASLNDIAFVFQKNATDIISGQVQGRIKIDGVDAAEVVVHLRERFPQGRFELENNFPGSTILIIRADASAMSRLLDIVETSFPKSEVGLLADYRRNWFAMRLLWTVGFVAAAALIFRYYWFGVFARIMILAFALNGFWEWSIALISLVVYPAFVTAVILSYPLETCRLIGFFSWWKKKPDDRLT